MSVFLVLFSACGGERTSHFTLGQGAKFEFETVYQGAGPAPDGGGANVARLLCDRDRAERLLRAWQLPSALPRLPSVNFSRSCLVAVRAAGRPSTGYRIRVSAIRLLHGHAILTATVNGQAGASGMAISRPYALLKVDRSQAAAIARPIVVRIR